MIAHRKYCVTDKEASCGGECPKRDSDNDANRKRVLECANIPALCFVNDRDVFQTVLNTVY
jgi:hypothetical protein